MIVIIFEDFFDPIQYVNIAGGVIVTQISSKDPAILECTV